MSRESDFLDLNNQLQKDVLLNWIGIDSQLSYANLRFERCIDGGQKKSDNLITEVKFPSPPAVLQLL